MPLVTPSLDDRTFDQLFDLAATRIRGACPNWELSPGDPGVVLLDAFAHLTEVLLYRLNRLPDKAYVEFLRLIGVRLLPPAAATVELVFSRRAASEQPVDVPRGTRVTVARPSGGSPAPIFTTCRAARIEPGATSTRVIACHADLVEAELLGAGTGQPRLSLTTRRHPIVARTGDLELVVGVEAEDTVVPERERSVEYDGRIYRVWTEVDHFANHAESDTVFVADRTSGLITFAPAIMPDAHESSGRLRALAAVPGHGRRIRAWYWHGGGAHGNVAAQTLTVLRDSIPSVTVTNPERASGGRDAESLEHALIRGPQEFRTIERAVTAADFENFATAVGGIARARAVAQAEVWTHAAPGTVEVLLVPDLPAAELDGPMDARGLRERHHELTRQTIQQDLDRRRPLGTRCLVNWANYKTVRVRAKLVTFREEDEAAVRRRFLERLYRTINPVTWRFGQPLRASHVYDLLLAEPGVNYVEDVRFEVEHAPSKDVAMVTHVPARAGAGADRLQPGGLWFAASAGAVFRSANDGTGWERCASFGDDAVAIVTAHFDRPGLVAAVTDTAGDTRHSALHVSDDAGETWRAPVAMAFHVESAAWAMRGATPVLFLATDVGLFEMATDDEPEIVQVRVDPKNPKRGFSAVAAVAGLRGAVSIAVAAQDNGGVFLSTDAGRPDTFAHVGLAQRDIRVLTAQYDGPRAFLWAGFAASQGATGTGAARLELIGAQGSAEGWTEFQSGWEGGSCWSIAFNGSTAFAASYQAGVLRLDINAPQPAWKAPSLSSGLPLRGGEHLFRWVKSVAAARDSATVLCSGADGIFASTDAGVTFGEVSSPVHRSTVTLPPTWLFCSGEHDVTVVEGT